MPLDRAVQRVVGRYRLIFRTALVGLATSAVLMVCGVMLAIVASTFSLLAFSMILTGVSGLNAYMAVKSTVKILDAHPEERRLAESVAGGANGWR